MTELDDAQALADSVQKLRIAYEQYFAGVERHEPVKERDRLKKELRRLMTVRSNNTAYKFKLQSTQATFVTYENHWDRIVRQIEDGTFKRDRLKAQKHLQAMKDVTDDVELIEDAEPVNDLSKELAGLEPDDALKSLEPDDGDVLRELREKGLLQKAGAVANRSPTADGRIPIADNRAPIADGRKPMADSRAPMADSRKPMVDNRAPAPAPRPAAPPAAPVDPIRQLHAAFTAARAQTGESKPVSVEALAETIRKQSAAVKAQLGCERVEFRVAIKDGKAVLKAIPK
ncbi:MAG: MXAN_5187 C-terminal domain-containing protein [Myxococcota bacterium]|nr:MXAN_5187 C-terminal domain-containing protein [Myxococcota bacterium]